MNSIFRGLPVFRASIPMRPVHQGYRTVMPSVRFNSQGSYGNGSSKSNTQEPSASRTKEHPGPPPPDVGQGRGGTDVASSQQPTSHETASKTNPSSSSRSSPEAEAASQQPFSSTTRGAPSEQGHEEHQIDPHPSNKAHPTLSTGQQSPNVDEQGHQRKDIPKDVKEHNEQVEKRHDRSFNQITDEGKVQKGF